MLPSSRTSRVRASWTNVIRIVGSSVVLTLLCGFAFATSGSSGAGAKPPAGGAQFINPPTLNILPIARVTQTVDNRKRSTINGQTSPLIGSGSDLGRLNASTQLDHMIMVLQASTEQDHALMTLIDQQLDSGHANFHHWITPDQFGAALGVADSDIRQITDWLSSEGFTVEQVAPGKRFIQFSGSAGQVESAFQTEMHRYSINGDSHIANSTDITVPDALRPVIAGVPTLNDFFKTSDMKGARKTTLRTAPATGNAPMFDASNIVFSAPDYTNGTTHFVGAGDFAAIYNTVPLLTAGNDGTGVTVGIIGRTDINIADVQIYREFFGLKNNDPIFVVAGEDPGVVPGDDGESYLDVEVSGGAAPGATIEFITSRATLVTDGVDLSAMYAVQNNLTDIISESYGQCEANFSQAADSFYVNLWAQAAAQGQSVFVSSGDNGPAGCDSSNSNFSTSGYAVSALASTPYNVAVGGTIFAEGGGSYWGTAATATPPFASALGYIPETPWNEAKGSGATGAAGLWSGSGGVSAYVATPSWQSGFGVPVTDPAYPNGFKSDPAAPFTPGPHRYMPDVALAAAADHDGTLYCGEGICQLSSSGTIVNAGIVGGTSVAAPSMAGIQALVNQYNGGRQGQPNYVYYALADAQHTAGLTCQSNSTSLDSNCAFHDITAGNTLICGDSSCTAGNKLGWTATPGYDLATGLGSPNADSLAKLWATVTFRSTTTTLALSQTSSIDHGQTVTATGTVAPGSGGGVPSGQVAFLVSSGALGNPMNPETGGFLNNVPVATLDGSGNYSIDLSNLPGGMYTVFARYSGDTTFAASTSAPVQVSVSSETPTVTIAPNAFNCTTGESPQTTFNYGAYVWTDVTVTGASGQGVPTGTVTITDNGSTLQTSTLNANGQAHFLSGAIPTSSCVYGYTFQDTSPLTGGTHVLGATYSGDASFATATAAPVTVTIGQTTLAGALTTGSTNISSGDSVVLSLTLAGISSAGPGTASPTGTVTFLDTTTSTVLGTATLSGTSTFGGVATLTTTGITASGANSIQASWPGDSNYSALTSAAQTVTVQAGTATSVALTSSSNPSVIGGRPTFTATMTPATVTAGTVKFYDSFSGQPVLLGVGSVGAAHTATFRPATAVNLPAGVHQITAVYAGNATFDASTSAPFAQTFSPLATTLQLTVLGSGTCSQLFALQATLATSPVIIASTPPSGIVTFFDGGTQIATARFTTVSTSSDGYGLFTAQADVTVMPGSHTITATLSDPNYSSPTSNSQIINSSCTVPSIASSFTPSIIPIGGTSTLAFTLSNPNVGPMTGVTFTDTLPAGVVIASPNNVTNTCGGSVSAVAGSATISLTGGSIASSKQCAITVDVKGVTVGSKANTTSAVSADDSGPGDSTTASVTVLAPVLSESFDVPSMPLGGSTTLSFTVRNPFPATTLTGLAFTDTLPAGLVVATPNGLSSGTGDCQSDGGTVVAVAGSASISLSGATLNASDSCTFSVVVTAIQSGMQTNVTGNITSDEASPGNSASASVTVFVAGALSGTGTAVPNSGIVGATTQLNVTVMSGTNPVSTGITVTADLTSIGGSNAATFTDNGSGKFVFNATVGPTAMVGTQSIPVTITDAQGRTATTNIEFTVLAPGTLSGTGIAAPSAVAAGQSTVVLLMVSVNPANNPPSTGIVVTVDLSSIGGSATQQFYDDGTNGDQTANDGIYTLATRIPADVALGTKSLPVTITDGQSRTASTTIQLDIDDVIFADGFESL